MSLDQSSAKQLELTPEQEQQAKELAEAIANDFIKPLIEKVAPEGINIQPVYPYSYEQVDVSGKIYIFTHKSAEHIEVDGELKSIKEIAALTMSMVGIGDDLGSIQGMTDAQVELMMNNANKAEKAMYDSAGVENPFAEFGGLTNMLVQAFNTPSEDTTPEAEEVV
ncbi:MAG: hypothetical protein ACRCXZ_06095 [Patescibacteria group bacterium]